ncbi:MAG: hypothetical protein KA271_04660 [Propionivibrio sp.]|jgi:hypothetical protein|nr:hypothetical protein [Propionivibrio sp.]
MNPDESNLTLIHGGRDEIERELVRLVLTTFPIPEEEYNRLLSMLKPRPGRVSIATDKTGSSCAADSGCAESEA